MNNKITSVNIYDIELLKNLEPITTDRASNYADLWLSQNYIENFFKEINKIQNEIDYVNNIINQYIRNVEDISNEAVKKISGQDLLKSNKLATINASDLKVNVTNLNLTTIKAKDKLTIVKTKGTKTKVKLKNGKFAWIETKNLGKVTKTTTKTTNLNIKKLKVNVINKDGKKSLATIKSTDKLTIVKTKGTKTKVKLKNGNYAWMDSKNLGKVTKTTTKTANLNIKKLKVSTSSIIKLKSTDKLTIVKTKGTKTKIELANGSVAWINSKDIKKGDKK